MDKKKGAVRLCTTLETLGGSKSGIISFYNDIIDNAERNIGKMTTNGVKITDGMVRMFKDRRAEIFNIQGGNR